MDKFSNVSFSTNLPQSAMEYLEKAAEKGKYLDVETINGTRQFKVIDQSWLRGEFGPVSSRALELLQVLALQPRSETNRKVVELPPDRFVKVEKIFNKLAIKMFKTGAELGTELIYQALDAKISGRKENVQKRVSIQKTNPEKQDASIQYIDDALFTKDASRLDVTLGGKSLSSRDDTAPATQKYLTDSKISEENQKKICALMTQRVPLDWISEEIGKDATDYLMGQGLVVQGGNEKRVDCTVSSDQKNVIITHRWKLNMTPVGEDPIKEAMLTIKINIKVEDLGREPLPYIMSFNRTAFSDYKMPQGSIKA